MKQTKPKKKAYKPKKEYKYVAVNPITRNLLEKKMIEINKKRAEGFILELKVMEAIHSAVENWTVEQGVNA